MHERTAHADPAATAATPSAPATIDLDWLRARRACRRHLSLFERTFGPSAAVTRANLRRAATAGLDLNWLANQLRHDPASLAYRTAMAPAERAYNATVGSAWEAYEAAVRQQRCWWWCPWLWRKPEAMWQAYREAVAAADPAYREAQAAAIADALGLP